MYDLKKLKLAGKAFSVLYVEDNDKLREYASKLLHKFFKNVYTASDGVDGLKIFKKKKTPIVITDIKMPHMNGMELTKQIKVISPDTKVIIMSAFDSRDYLYSAIEFGATRFLKKPVNINEFAQVLQDTIEDIIKSQNFKIFHANLKNIFNYQSSIVVMMKGSELTFVNQMFLDFFKVDNIEDFIEKNGNLGDLFLEHKGFLYNSINKNWYDEISLNPQKLYNIKIQDKDEDFKHFILKYQEIPDKKSYGIISFDDVTELNLLKLYDSIQVKNDEILKDSKAMYKLLEVIKRNNAKIELHNFYKGLSIVHDALITDILEDSIILKTSYIQEKAIQFDKRSFITSDALPSVVACESVTKINFEKQSVEFTNIHFAATSPVDRQTPRVVPEEGHTISLFLGENKFRRNIFIEDISLEAVKLNVETMPAGLKMGGEVTLNMVLQSDVRAIVINTKAIMFRITESKQSFSIVFKFSFNVGEKKDLVEYMTSRQMAIIREFKGMQSV